jgi:predicted ester cyclase
MSRSVAIIALGLMLMTGLVLGQLHTVGVQTVPAATNSAGAAAARRFYDGINHFLAGGAPDTFLAELDSDFVDRSNPMGGEGSAEDLLRYLSSLRATFPDLRVAIADPLAQGESVAVDLSLTGDFSGTFAGIEVSAQDASGGFELLRVANGKIVERWGSRDLPPMYETLLETEGPEVSGWLIEPHLERYRLDPNAAIELDTSQGAVILAEAGTLDVAADEPFSPTPESGASTPIDQRAAAAGASEQATRLEPGQLLVAPPWATYLIWNSGNEPALLLFVVMHHLSPVTDYTELGRGTFAPGPGAEVLLAAGNPLRPYNGALNRSPYHLSIGRALLPPGAEIPSHIVAEVELVTVTRGSIDVSTSDGLVWLNNLDASDIVTRGSIDVSTSDGLVWWNAGPQTVQGRTTLNPGDGLAANFGSETSIRAASPGPTEFWFVTLRPGL